MWDFTIYEMIEQAVVITANANDRHALDKFYKRVLWKPTNKVTVANMQRTDDGGISSMTITININ